MKCSLIILSCLVFLSGCTPTFDFDVMDITPAKHKINANINEIKIWYEDPDTEPQFAELSKDDVLSGEYTHNINSAWFVSLARAIKKANIFDENSNKKANVFVTIKELDTPLFGLGMTAYVTAHYKILDYTSGKTLFDKTVESEGWTPLTYSFFGYKRALESVNRAVRKNISTFIAHLKSYKS